MLREAGICCIELALPDCNFDADKEGIVARNRIMRLLQSAAILGSAVVLCAALANAQTAESTYKSKCAACHGADGNPSAAGKSMGARSFSSPEVTKESDSDLAKAISDGRNKMPGYGKTLKEAEIKGLVGYVRDLGKK